MAVSEEFKDFVEAQLGRIMPIATKRMFGGLGIYGRGYFFALAADNVIYFKAGEANLPDFEAHGCQPFRPYDDDRTMNYYEVPGDVVEDIELLAAWMEKAIQVAAAAKK